MRDLNRELMLDAWAKSQRVRRADREFECLWDFARRAKWIVRDRLYKAKAQGIADAACKEINAAAQGLGVAGGLYPAQGILERVVSTLESRI